MRRPLYTAVTHGYEQCEEGTLYSLMWTPDRAQGYSFVARTITVNGRTDTLIYWNITVGAVNHPGTTGTASPRILGGQWTPTKGTANTPRFPWWLYNLTIVVPVPGALQFQMEGSGQADVMVSGWKLVWPTNGNITRPGTTLWTPTLTTHT